MSDAKADQIREALYDGIMLANQAGATAVPFKRNMEAAVALLPALARIGDVEDLDAAWAEAEAALHPGEYLSGFSRYDEGLPWAAQARSGPGGRHNIVTEPFDYHGHCSAFGPTPAAALRALAAKLREVGR